MKMYLSMLQVNQMIDQLANLIVASGRCYKNVVGIANGGLPISRPLANKLHLPHSSIRVSHYDGRQLRAKPLIEGTLPQPTGNLIVDDLIDGGWTMNTFEQHFGLVGNATAVLFWKEGSFQPDFYVQKKPETWIVFPWSK